jgi:hypothetical protein
VQNGGKATWGVGFEVARDQYSGNFTDHLFEGFKELPVPARSLAPTFIAPKNSRTAHRRRSLSVRHRSRGDVQRHYANCIDATPHFLRIHAILPCFCVPSSQVPSSSQRRRL